MSAIKSGDVLTYYTFPLFFSSTLSLSLYKGNKNKIFICVNCVHTLFLPFFSFSNSVCTYIHTINTLTHFHAYREFSVSLCVCVCLRDSCPPSTSTLSASTCLDSIYRSVDRCQGSLNQPLHKHFRL